MDDVNPSRVPASCQETCQIDILISAFPGLANTNYFQLEVKYIIVYCNLIIRNLLRYRQHKQGRVIKKYLS